jgi:leucyl/phenylalanyl-tRNA--protein transferase
MFSATTGGSKVALICLGHLLRRWGFPLLDAQVGNPHLYRMGAKDMPREQFLEQVHELSRCPPAPDAFRLDVPAVAADLAAAAA